MKRIIKHALTVIGVSLAIGIPVRATAGTATSNLTVSASITANCTISTSALAFGAYDPVVTNASTALNGTGSVTTTCSTGASPVVTLGQGSNANTGSTDTVPLRRMVSSGNYLSYYLYQNNGHTTVWGNTSGTAPSAVTGTGTAQTVTVYGQVTGGQNVATGSYTDTVVATVTF